MAMRLDAGYFVRASRQISGGATLNTCVLLTLPKRDGHAIDAQFSATADAFRKAMRALK